MAQNVVGKTYRWKCEKVWSKRWLVKKYGPKCGKVWSKIRKLNSPPQLIYQHILTYINKTLYWSYICETLWFKQTDGLIFVLNHSGKPCNHCGSWLPGKSWQKQVSATSCCAWWVVASRVTTSCWVLVCTSAVVTA